MKKFSEHQKLLVNFYKTLDIFYLSEYDDGIIGPDNGIVRRHTHDVLFFHHTAIFFLFKLTFECDKIQLIFVAQIDVLQRTVGNARRGQNLNNFMVVG